MMILHWKLFFSVLAVMLMFHGRTAEVQAFTASTNPARSTRSIYRWSVPQDLSLTAIAVDGGGGGDRTRLPGGRPTRFPFLSFLFDDTLRLLNPKTMASYQVQRHKQYGSVFKTNIFFRPTVFVTDETNLKLLGLEESSKSLQAFFPPHHQKLFGPQSIIVQSGAKHAQLRRIIQTSMSPTVIRSYMSTIERCFDEFLSNLRTESDFVAVVPRMRSFFIALTLDVVLGAAQVDADTKAKLVEDIGRWSQGLLAPPLTFLPWSTASRALRARRRVAERLNDIIDAQPSGSPMGLLWSLLAASEADEEGGVTRTDVLDNVFTILFAGSDTTASACVSLWRLLSLSPELREHLRENPGEPVRQAVVDKVFQTSPPAPFTMRLTTEDLQVGDYTVPANWLVVYGLAGALLTGDDPARGDRGAPDAPSNDSSGSAAARPPPTSSLAFGAGPRRCPGRFLAALEIDVFLQKLVGLDWELRPDQNLEQRYTPGFFPVDGLALKLT